MRCEKCEFENDDSAAFCANCGAPLEQSENRLGTYILRGELGRGAMARVWRAWDPNLEREVAIKEPLFDPRLSEDVLEEMGRRFVKEGRAAARLQHPNIVSIYAADVYNGRPAIVMELVQGVTLGAILERGPLEPPVALDALDQLLDAVGYAHSKGVVHRDIKPDNVFVSEEGHVKLADFGIARVDDGAATRATTVGAVLGTPGYMSPEQATGAPVDARSDLFSIGVVGYEMLTGRNPFGAGDGGDSTTLLYRIVHEPAPELPPSAAAGLPADLRPAIMAALAKNPMDRPQTAADLKAMLHGFAPTPAPAPTPGFASAYAPAPAPTPYGTQQTQASQGLANSVMKTASSMPKWVPYVLVAVICALILVIVLVMALSGGGVGSAPPVNTGPASTASTASGGAAANSANSPVYLGVKDGKVAIYVNSSAEPYEVSDLEVARLASDEQAKIDTHPGYGTVEEAQVAVQEMKDKVAVAEKKAQEEAAKAKEAERQQQEQAKRDYIFPNSSSDYLSRSEVEAVSSDDLAIAMNEIWARHGRRFKNNWLQSYFNSKSWYSGTIAPDDFLSRYTPTRVEDENSKLINAVLTERGYDVNAAHPN